MSVFCRPSQRRTVRDVATAVATGAAAILAGGVGNSEEAKLYAQMDARGLLDRLLKKRPLLLWNTRAEKCYPSRIMRSWKTCSGK